MFSFSKDEDGSVVLICNGTVLKKVSEIPGSCLLHVDKGDMDKGFIYLTAIIIVLVSVAIGIILSDFIMYENYKCVSFFLRH